MKLLFLILALVLTVYTYNYSEYLKDYNKTYPQSENLLLREQIFNNRAKSIEQTNAQNIGYKLSINNYTDWTDEELRTRNKVNINTDVNTSVVKQKSNKNLKTSSSLVDWRMQGKVTPIKNQGSCGSCWAFAGTALFESFLLLENNPAYDISEQYVLECSNSLKSDCSGGYTTDALELLLKRGGAPTQQDFPYTAGGSPITPNTPNICSTKKDKIKLNGYSEINTYSNVTDSQLMTLLQGGPVAVHVYADAGFNMYSSGVYFCPNKTLISNLNHAILLVGYDSGKWIVKNSWGTSWGMQGFMYLNMSSNCGVNYWVYQIAKGYSNKQTNYSHWMGISIVLAVLLFMF